MAASINEWIYTVKSSPFTFNEMGFSVYRWQYHNGCCALCVRQPYVLVCNHPAIVKDVGNVNPLFYKVNSKCCRCLIRLCTHWCIWARMIIVWGRVVKVCIGASLAEGHKRRTAIRPDCDQSGASIAYKGWGWCKTRCTLHILVVLSSSTGRNRADWGLKYYLLGFWLFCKM